MKIKNYIEFVSENNTFDYGCVMLNLNVSNWSEIISIIDEEDIYTEKEKHFGLVDNPHVTLLYGLHKEVSLDDVKSVFEGIDSISIKITGVNIFENEKFDVVKFDIEPSGGLLEINKKLEKFPFTSDYPEYKPHCTIAYVKKGTGKKYVRPDYKYTIKNSSEIIYSVSDKEYNFKVFEGNQYVYLDGLD